MAVLKKIRSRWWSQTQTAADYQPIHESPLAVVGDLRYDIRPLSISQLDETWRLDQRCFVDGEVVGGVNESMGGCFASLTFAHFREYWLCHRLEGVENTCARGSDRLNHRLTFPTQFRGQFFDRKNVWQIALVKLQDIGKFHQFVTLC